MRPLVKKAGNRLTLKIATLRHSYIDNFIFIHINKTGGSSIAKALKLPVNPKTVYHKTALEKIGEIGRQQWENRFTFTVIRNPWDKVVSHYHFRVQTNQTNLGIRRIGFKDWIRLAYGDKDPFYYNNPKMFQPQSDWITDLNGKILVNYICRFENLDDDFSYVCRKLGKSVSLPHVKASEHGHYSDYYDEETIKIVASWFKKDIQNFGYLF